MRRTAHVCCASHHKRVMALLAAQCAPSPALPPLLGPRQHPPGPACRGSSAPSCGTARSSPPPALTPQRRRTQPAREGVSQHTGVAILSNRKISKLGRSCRAAVEDGLSVRTVTRGGTAEHAGPGRRCRRVSGARRHLQAPRLLQRRLRAPSRHSHAPKSRQTIPNRAPPA